MTESSGQQRNDVDGLLVQLREEVREGLEKIAGIVAAAEGARGEWTSMRFFVAKIDPAGSAGQAVEARAVETSAIDAAAVEVQVIEEQAIETQIVEAQSGDTRGAEISGIEIELTDRDDRIYRQFL